MSHPPHVTNYRILTDSGPDRLSAQVETAIQNARDSYTRRAEAYPQ